MTGRFRLSRRARTDLTNIGRYTARTWGKAQRDAYLTSLYGRMARLAQDPANGRARRDIRPGLYDSPQGAHLIFYRIERGEVVIVAILHKAMDLHAHFEDGIE